MSELCRRCRGDARWCCTWTTKGGHTTCRMVCDAHLRDGMPTDIQAPDLIAFNAVTLDSLHIFADDPSEIANINGP